MERDACISPCGLYRYWLSRRWSAGPPLVWVMLNPSTADAEIDDPTIRKVVGFSDRIGVPAAIVVNVWALRATDPKDLHAKRQAYEPENLDHVDRIVTGREVVVAWGGNVAVGPGLTKIKLILQKGADNVFCLGYTKGKRCGPYGTSRVGRQPRHPLMLSYQTPLELFDWGI